MQGDEVGASKQPATRKAWFKIGDGQYHWADQKHLKHRHIRYLDRAEGRFPYVDDNPQCFTDVEDAFSRCFLSPKISMLESGDQTGGNRQMAPSSVTRLALPPPTGCTQISYSPDASDK